MRAGHWIVLPRRPCVPTVRAGAYAGMIVSSRWKHQIRLVLRDAMAEVARRDARNPALAPLTEVLERYRATIKCQFDAFAEYVAEAERRGIEGYPLYAWTKATIEDPAKKAKYLRSFTIYVDGNAVYEQAIADALESALRPLLGGDLVATMSRYDTNPANNPQPPSRFRK